MNSASVLTSKFHRALGVAVLAGGLPGLAAAEDVIRWGNASAASLPHILPVMIEMHPELQEKYGFKIDMTNFAGNSANCMSALIGGSVDFCQTGIASGLYAIAEGAEIKSFSAMGGQVGEIVISKQAAEKVGLMDSDPVVEKLKKLKGLQIVGSGPGTPNYMLLDAIMQDAGLSVADLNFRTLVDITAMNEGVRNGSIDGTYWSVGGMAPAQSEGAAVQVVSLARGDLPDLKTIPLTAVFVNAKWLEEHKDLAKKAKDAMAEALKELQADPIGYTAAYKETFHPNTEADVWKSNLEQNIAAFYPDMNGPAEGWDFWINIMKKENPAAEKASHANAFVNVD